MGIYILNIVLLILSTLLFRKSPNYKKILVIIVGIQLFIISAFRSVEVGTDLRNYIPFFNRVANSSWNELFLMNFELGFVLFNKFIGIFTNSPTFFLMFVSAFIVIGLSKFIYENSRIPWLSFFLLITLGYFASSFNLIRLYMALVIVLNVYKYVISRNFIKYLLGVFVASLFHQTALIALVIYPIFVIKITLKYIILLFLTSILIYVNSDRITNIILQFSRHEYYAIAGEGYFVLLLLISITIFTLLFYSRVKDEDQILKLFFHTTLIATVLQILSLNFSLFVRAVIYFVVPIIILIPNLINSQKDKGIRVLVVYIICILTFAFYYFKVLDPSSPSGIMPYQFFWEN